MSLLVKSKILGLFRYPLTANFKYFFRKSDNLPQLIQMQFYKKQMNFFGDFAQFLKSTSNFEPF